MVDDGKYRGSADGRGARDYNCNRVPLRECPLSLAGPTTIVPDIGHAGAMPRALAALSPKEEENVREVLAMRCRAACRPYLQGP